MMFGGDSTVSFFGNTDGYVFEVNDSNGSAGDAEGLFGAISGVWTIDPWTSNVTTVSGGPGSFSIWDGDGEAFMAELDFDQVGTVLSGGVMNGASNLTDFSYGGSNMDLMELYEWGWATLSLSFEVAQGPANLSLDYLGSNKTESTFSGDVASRVPDSGTTSAMLGLGIFFLAAIARRKSWAAKS